MRLYNRWTSCTFRAGAGGKARSHDIQQPDVYRILSLTGSIKRRVKETTYGSLRKPPHERVMGWLDFFVFREMVVESATEAAMAWQG